MDYKKKYIKIHREKTLKIYLLKFKMKELKKVSIRSFILSLLLYLFTMLYHDTRENKRYILENFAQCVIENKYCNDTYNPDIASDTLFLLKTSSTTNHRYVTSINCCISMFSYVTIIESRKTIKLFFNQKIIAVYSKKHSDFQFLTEWHSESSPMLMNSARYLVYIDLIHFTKNIKDIIHYLNKPSCMKCVCFLLSKKQKLIGFSGPKNQTMKLLKNSNLVKKLQDGLNSTNSISTKSVLMDGIAKLQYCGYDSKENLCNGESEHNTDSNRITQQLDVQNILKDEVFHIVYATSMEQMAQTSLSIKSILKTSRTKSILHFHIFYYTQISGDHLDELEQVVTGCGALITFHMYNGVEEVEPLINYDFGRSDLISPNNYIRMLMHEKLPGVKWCLWLDNDVYAMKDITSLFAKVYVEGDSKVVASFPITAKTAIQWKVFQDHGVKVSESMYPRVQAGILFINLEKWRKDDVFAQVLKISQLNRQLKIYNLWGSQAPFELLFNGDNFYQLNPNLIQQKLGYRKIKSMMYIPCDAMFLHWSGPRKPWLSEWRNTPQNELLWNHVLNQTNDLRC